MGDLISRQLLLSELENTPIRLAVDKGKVFRMITEAPTVDAVPVEQYNELKRRYKKVCENADILDAALREYQRLYEE